MPWRNGAKVPLNVYDERGRPICQCHTVADAERIVAAVNASGAAWHLCQSLLACREAVTEDLIREVSNALEAGAF